MVKAPLSAVQLAQAIALKRTAERQVLRSQVDQFKDERQDFRSYLPSVHRTDSGKPAYPPNHLEFVITEMLRAGGHRVIVAPPGSAKTNTMIGRTAWKLGNDPTLHVGYFCETASQAYGRSVAIRDTIERNQNYRAIFPDVVPDYRKGWAESQWFLARPDTADKDPSLLAAGVGGAIMGARLDDVVLDDIASPRNMATAEQRAKIIAWLVQSVLTRLTPNAVITMITTRWHEADPVAWARSQGWRVVTLQAVQGDLEDGVSYWPERFPINKLACPGGLHGQADPDWEPSEEQPVPPCWVERGEEGQILNQGVCELFARGTRDFNLVYQGETVDDSSAILKRAWWKFYGGPEQPVLPKAFQQKAIIVDLAHELKKEADYTTIGAWATGWPNYYCTLMIKRRLEFPEVQALLRGMCLPVIQPRDWEIMAEEVRNLLAAMGRLGPKDRPPFPDFYVVIENTPGSKGLIQTLQREIGGRVVAWKPKGNADKVARAHATAGRAEHGLVFLPNPRTTSWVAPFIEECAAFPNGEHDDQVDNYTQAIMYFERAGTLYTS